MVEVYIGIGTNLGNREKNIQKSLELISDRCKILKKSSIIETEPVGFLKQGKFLNMVICLLTELSAKDLLLFLKNIELKMGRKSGFKNGPRIIDLDILFYGSDIIDLNFLGKDFNEKFSLIVPHPRLHKRRFVIEPMCEIAFDFVHPKFKKTIFELLEKINC